MFANVHAEEEANFHHSSDTDWDNAEARELSGLNPDQEWVLTDRDVWHKNPFYTGEPGPHPEDDHYEEDPNGLDFADSLAFILAGNSTVTFQGANSRFTFKITRAKDSKFPLWFVKVLSGADNQNDFTFLGTLQNRYTQVMYVHSRKSDVSETASSVAVFKWVINRLINNQPHDDLGIFHEGRCGRCGRKLTVPGSIESGYGPNCAAKIGEV
jgi:hypothetical protein